MTVWPQQWSAAENYPGAPGWRRRCRPEAEGVLHAGTTRRDDGAIVSSGGRVLSVVGTGADLSAARAHAYEISVQFVAGGLSAAISVTGGEGKMQRLAGASLAITAGIAVQVPSSSRQIA